MSPSALFITTVPVTLEKFLAPFANHFRSTGWRVDALANAAASYPPIAESFDQRFDVAWSRNPVAPSNLIGSAGRVRSVVEAGGYDVVHVHTPIAAWVTRYALRRRPRGAGSRPQLIYTAHGFHFFEGQAAVPHAFFRTMERIAAPWTDYLITINQQDFAAGQALGGIPPARVRLIPGIGVDADALSPGAVPAEEVARVRRGLLTPASVSQGAAPAPQANGDAFLLVMVAEFSPVKRHSLALEALGQVKDERVVLVLVGNGPLEADIHAEVARRGLADRVRFAGYRQDIPAILAASDALLICSEREGLNRSALEAMAAARPVIGTDTRGIADAIGEDSGWIVGTDDATGLATAIEYAAAHPNEAARRGVAGRNRAVSEFALTRIIGEYEELYAEALA